ncbi:alpha/beta fold hydrolase [Ramlibacter alkalitolerans]|uniref:Alpha/beta hydrolase n=1 Tax=Ramlibacter alkalitolerans TaxID=2039631 RepID=A0ABS1JK68_9BURK|nr:alpha/beta hydrolase [Ramlibacter alkalitolerans]MBL0424321.1 alpha/beta hydrolase [Ramlibacter alkalitolerans]
MSLIVFSHANSFPASTYRVLFRELRSRGFAVKAIEKFGHEAAYPVTNNWPHLVQQLHDFAAREVEQAGEPAFLVGHSLGGFLSILCAARHPRLAAGVLLLDSPLVGGWKSHALRAVKSTPLVGALTPGAVSRKRRHRWPSQADALEHFRRKKAFARWDAQVLADYIAHGTQDEAGERVLGFDRDIETAIYNTLPDDLERVLRRHPLRCPVAFIGGLQSEEIRQVGLAMTRRISAGRMTMIDGSHLFPMEKPLATAAAIEAALRALPGP